MFNHRVLGVVARMCKGFALLALMPALGCASMAAAVNTTRAARAVQRAESAHADADAPFEVTLARVYLAKAREESSEAAYQDAVRYARYSEENALKAVELSRKRRQGVEK